MPSISAQCRSPGIAERVFIRGLGSCVLSRVLKTFNVRLHRTHVLRADITACTPDIYSFRTAGTRPTIFLNAAASRWHSSASTASETTHMRAQAGSMRQPRSPAHPPHLTHLTSPCAGRDHRNTQVKGRPWSRFYHAARCSVDVRTGSFARAHAQVPCAHRSPACLVFSGEGGARHVTVYEAVRTSAPRACA